MSKLRPLSNLLLSLGLLSSPLIAASAPALPATAGQISAQTLAQQLNRLADDYYERQARFEPLSATYNGDNRFDDQLPMTLKPTVRAEQIAMIREIAAALAQVPRRRLSGADLLNYDCLQFELSAALAMARFDNHLLPLNQMDSIPVALAHFASGQSAQPLKAVADYEIFLRRIEQLPDWIAQAVTNMREGMRRGIVLPKALVRSTLPQYQQLVEANVERHPYYAPVNNFPTDFSQADRARLTQAYRNAVAQRILPALVTLDQFLAGEYLAASRTSTGWSDLPGGAEWYRAWVRDQTTTDLDPETIHQTGLREVARIQSEFARLGPKLGYHGDPTGLPGWIDTQAEYRPFHTEAEVLEGYRKIDRVVRSKLPQLFGRIPKAALDIRPEPEISRDTASDHYSAPAIDGSRPGVFWAVITDPAQYPTTEMTTLFLHEGQPGHHFHLATLQELDLPKFRKFGGNNAYTEGWALYAETLGKEMGLFENDPNAYLGHLTDELLRATRLVVDTGMHVKGWTREQGIAYLQATLGYNEAGARNAIERYMAWPGQALGYKIGALKIVELRQRAERELGPRFDLRAFHDEILSDGTLPLALLEQKMARWMEKQKNVQ